jgi:hypothetical protein
MVPDGLDFSRMPLFHTHRTLRSAALAGIRAQV